MLARKIWLLLAFTCVFGSMILLSGIVYAFMVTPHSVYQGEPIEDPIERERRAALKGFGEDTIVVVVMGDSIARGMGDETGDGLTSELVNLFQENEKQVEVVNIAVDGLESDELLELIESEQTDELLQRADLILISIGGNDLRGVLRGDMSILKTGEIDEIQEGYLDNVSNSIDYIRELNEESYIAFVGLYNPFDIYSLDDDYSDIDLIEFLKDWNYQTQLLVEEDNLGVFVPTYDLFKWNIEQFMSRDGIHPNAAGYQAIASRIATVFRSIVKLD
ncbi:hypothetical protein BHU72_06825 [Desulfuribacillus stibiiarsenatis]|uniref:SGNH hydrolase-type esterase domain-containing protein n=1 Tax=Desulfuribacillus stibiiarsenatis TaxID=1390249 RepID=A0A1E5L489_9FIRM|nr:GDSL-type esterase/lipase family protein [Desulfuribacillus stibiiarsenatis]OEH84901.1 hypothetical protein BHU72_06825 [Desulfuribacillus stibiiarsenatis]